MKATIAFLLSLAACILAQDHSNPSKRPEAQRCVPELSSSKGFKLQEEAYSYSDFNVISFGNMHATEGQVSGRLFVGGNATFGPLGFTVGKTLHTTGYDATDNERAFSLVVGDTLCWKEGNLYPDGTNHPYRGHREMGYVGHTNHSCTASYLSRRMRAGSLPKGTIQDMRNHFINISSQWASMPPNCYTDVHAGGIFVSGPRTTSHGYYYIHVTAKQLESANWWAFRGNLDVGSYFIVTVTSDQDIVFHGGSFPALPGRVIFNVPNAVNVVIDGGIKGSILAPKGTLVESEGDSTGFLVFDQIRELDVAHKPICHVKSFVCPCCNTCERSTCNGAAPATFLN